MYYLALYRKRASLVAQTVKCLLALREKPAPPLGWKDPLERKWQPTPVFLPEKPHRQRDRGAWQATVHGVAKGWNELATKPPSQNSKIF